MTKKGNKNSSYAKKLAKAIKNNDKKVVVNKSVTTSTC